MCSISARLAGILGPRFCGARAARSPASRWRRQVLSDDEYTPSRRISAPTSPGRVQRSAAPRMRRLSALENCRRRACGTTSALVSGDVAGGAEASASDKLLTACTAAFG